MPPSCSVFFPPYPMAPKPNVQGVTDVKINGALNQLRIISKRLVGYGLTTAEIVGEVRRSAAEARKDLA